MSAIVLYLVSLGYCVFWAVASWAGDSRADHYQTMAFLAGIAAMLEANRYKGVN